MAAANAGGRVELVGSVSDDAEGDAVVTELGRAGIGHAALLRELPRSRVYLDAADIELGLRYVPECQVLVVADVLDPDGLRVVADAATYHRAALIVVATDEETPLDLLPEDAVVLAPPAEDVGAFTDAVAAYAVAIDAGRPAADAWQEALGRVGWEPSAE